MKNAILDQNQTINTDPALFDAGYHEHAGYAAALEHLYGRLNTEALDPANFARVERNLDDFLAFLKPLGDPHLATPTIHLTGTRGKGSTLAMLEAILIQAGYSTGATVSPHLIEVRERIRINGDDISRQLFALNYENIRPIADKMMRLANFRTVFELITALAFVSFKKASLDVALVEVGMGGRLDATNIISPTLSIITHIGLDHMHILGNTVEAIAEDKGHIIKPVAPAIISRQPDGARRVLEQRCKEVGVECWRLDHEVQINSMNLFDYGSEITVSTPHRAHSKLHIPLLGAHQAENAATAIAAADCLDMNGKFEIPAEAVNEGLLNTRWHGRGEILGTNPIFMIDGAHTDQGARALSNLLDSVFADKRRIMILGMNRDKDPDLFLNSFETPPHLMLATKAESPRSLTAHELAEIVRGKGIRCETVELHDAINRALEIAEPNDIIIATGSFYVIGALRRIWLREMDASSTFKNSPFIDSLHKRNSR